MIRPPGDVGSRVGAVVVAAVAAVLCGGLAAGGVAAAELNPRRVAQQVSAAVAATYPDLPVTDVTCPKKIKQATARTDVCVADARGLSLQLAVTQTDRKGNVTIASRQAVIPKANAEQFVAANATLPAQVDCGPDTYIVRLPGAPFTCTVRFADGTTQQVSVSVVDVAET